MVLHYSSIEALGCQSCGHVKKDKEFNKLALSFQVVELQIIEVYYIPVVIFKLLWRETFCSAKEVLFLMKKMNADFVK